MAGKEEDDEEFNKMMGVANQQANIGKRQATKALEAQESKKEQIVKFKEKRTVRQASVQMPHRHICDMVSFFLGIDIQIVIEGICDFDYHIDIMESFLNKDGIWAMTFCYHDGPPYEVATGRMVKDARGSIKRVYVSPSNHLMQNKGVIVYRINQSQVDMRNINDVVFFVECDLDYVKGNVIFLSSLLIREHIAPCLETTKDWGDLSKTEAGMKRKRHFESDFSAFCTFLDKTKDDLESIITFVVDPKLVKELKEGDNDQHIFDKEFRKTVESTVRIWTKRMEKALVQYQQLRREDEFVGPDVEVEYWRNQLSRFTSIKEFTLHKDCELHIEFIELIGSPIAKVWKKYINEVTDARNECADNVKYLYSFEVFSAPLYHLDPPDLCHHIPALLSAIRMIYTTSRYFNNKYNMTAILIKVSNQIVKVCRNYLNCNGTKTVWNQPKVEVLKKVKECLDLQLKYYQCYHQVGSEMAAAEEKLFGCSEMFLFGKLETFKKRIEQICDVLQTTLTYSILQASMIEGIEVFAQKFKDFFEKISSQKYDALNHRQPFFDKDYAAYRQNVVDVEWELEEFVGASLSKLQDVDNVLRLLARFEKLNLPCLRLDERYLEAMLLYQEELEVIRDRYNEERRSPLVPRNMPPASGRIRWIRQYYRRIEIPMLKFRTLKKVIKHRKVQQCIQLFNALSMVFIHYEQLYHEGWCQFVAQVRNCLNTPVMVRHQVTGRYLANFDEHIMESIREAEYMYRLHLTVPDVGQILVYCKEKILNGARMIKELIQRNDALRSNIPLLFVNMMRAPLYKLEVAFLPAFSVITWTSLRIHDFHEQVSQLLDEIELFVKEVKDMQEARIDEVLQRIIVTPLVYLPDTALFPQQFYEENVKYSAHIVRDLEQKSVKTERAVIELINKFLDLIDQEDLQVGKYDWLDPELAVKPVSSSSKLNVDPNAAFRVLIGKPPLDLPTLKADCVELFSYFNMKFFETLVRMVKGSLESLNEKATSLRASADITPIIRTKMQLQIPNIVINPDLTAIQTTFAKVVSNVLECTKYIHLWGQRGVCNKKSSIKLKKKDLAESSEAPEIAKLNYYKSVTDNKEVMRLYMNLQGAMYLIQPDVAIALKKYLKYANLWDDKREHIIDRFCGRKPLPVEITEKFREYEFRSYRISLLPNELDLGPILIDLGELKLALIVESNAWKYILGNNLAMRNKQKLNKMVDFIKTQEKAMSRKIKDLDDCRLAMQCLERIRENFIEMDMDLGAMEEAYSILNKFKIEIPKEDIERVDTLRFNFTNMQVHAKQTQEVIYEMQAPLLEELKAGVAIFASEVEIFDQDFEERGPMVPGLEARDASDRVLVFQDRFDELWRKFEMYSSGEKLFGLDVNDYPVLHKRKKEFNLLNKLYGLYLQVNKGIDGYFDILWSDVDTEVIIAELAEFQSRCRKLPKALKDWPAFLDLKKKIDDFSETCPLLELMANKAMKDRHWKRLSATCNYNFDIDSPTFTLGNVMEAPLLQYKDDVEDICISAVKEKDIEAKLKQVIADWAIVDLSFSSFKARGELLLKGTETGEIIMALEDSLMIMNSLLSNRYNAPFKRDIQLWVHKLVTTSEILERWMLVQNLWVYLEAVFVGGDIAKQLPAEAKRFSNIDRTWVKIMARARETPNAVECCTGDETMGQLLPHLFEQLETCQKSLTGYLESKRLLFPRFFFISDPVLLEILGQSSDPTSIKPHLLSLFDAVASVDFDEKKPDFIINMKSDLGEVVAFEKPVQCAGGVEYWLTTLLNTVKTTVQQVVAQQSQCLADPEYEFVSGFQLFCGQAGLLGVQILWTKDSEIALRRCKIDKTIMRNTNQKFLDLLNSLIDLTSKDLTKMMRIQFETMVTIHVHQKDIFDDMVKLRIKTPQDFEWQKQSRFYYYEDSDEVQVKITDVIFDYQNEYLGITERLAITPLTDRCYITLAQAIWINMGGAPAGPAGTGKTETTKDMGRTLGKFVVVFNCSDQMDFRGLGRIFKGLAQSGTWGCFDEFNRIELPVLSVAAQQIYIVLQARKERKAVFIFMDGDNVSMNIEFGIFLTMNPGYAGRQELPENLKIMFRNVAMMVPDRQIIIRVKLASCGFKDNVYLSRKFFTLYALCEGQLSKQVHYDFGLRNILSVLRTLGAQKRANPTDSEETTVMRVLRDMNLSKLIDEDEPLFLSLIEDMFPGIRLTTHTWKDLQKAITNQTANMGLINYPVWNLKLVQLYETSLVRHGLMVLGPTGAGKTECMHCLMRSFTEMGAPHKELRMNPKAITAPQMFGRLDVATNDWTDGIFSTLWRRTLKFKKTDYCWLVLDGPVDAVWIENLNSVLDDNKTLTLANGDRIVMAANCKLVFEPDNVDNASPATVSRMGMVFMSSSVLPWMPILEGCLKTRSQQERDAFKTMFGKIYNDVQDLVAQKLKPKMFLREAIYIRQCYDVLQGILDVGEEQKNWTERQLERLFLFAMMWSLGALLELEDRAKLEAFVLTHPSKMDWPKIGPNETIFEYLVNPDNGRWQHWSERVEAFIYPTDSVLEFTSILVPNVDNVRTAFLIQTIAKQSKAVLLIGEQGTAKTVMIQGYLASFDPDYKLSKSFNFSSATTPNMVQRIIESYIDKRVGTTYGPPAGKTLSVFIDDINMPVINDWGDQITNEIVRQLMECSGFYSLDKPGDFSTVVDVMFLAAMIHPGGGRNDIPHRLKRQFSIFNCTLPSITSMDLIFKQIACGYFCSERFLEPVVGFIERLIPLTRHVWEKTKVKMLPTPAKFHYVFNLRDLSRIWQGILTVESEQCTDEVALLQLWRHECHRVISDRFTEQNDKEWFIKCLGNTVQIDLEDDAKYYTEEEVFWVDFMREVPEATGDEPDDFVFEAPKVYEAIPSWQSLKDKLLGYMEQYNEQVRGAAMDMVFFRDAMVNLMIISRVIRTARGNALLVGVGGSGKQSLTKLASFIATYKSYQIQLTRSYNLNNLMEDIKYLYRVAGLEGRGITFIFTDNEIKEETFLESLNNILSSGEIANLFPKDELDEIQSELIPIMKKIQPKRPPTVDNLYDFFISRARSNIHVVLCFSPVGEKFRSRALKFPGLISGCTVNWFARWPRDALIEVASHFLETFPVVCVPEVKIELINIMAEIQDGVAEVCNLYYERFRRRTFVTPKTFISFLNFYKTLYKKKLDDIGVSAHRMKTGLEKLVEAQVSVDELRKELAVKEIEVNIASDAAEEVLKEVLSASEVANKIKEEALTVKDRAENLVNLISVDQREAEEKLLEAKPALDAAEAALLTIKAADIATRKLDRVQRDTVNEKDFLLPSWNESLKMLADTRFLAKLQEYPKDTINAETIDLVTPYLRLELYTYEIAKNVCGNVAGLVSWTIAMAAFYEVNKEVLPLKVNLQIQQAKLNKAQEELNTAMTLLASKEEEVRQCQMLYEEAMTRKQAVLDDAMKVKNKMDAATALINGLAGERIRWTAQLQQFKAETERLVGDVVILVGFLGYSGPFNQEFRNTQQKTWLESLIKRKIPVTAALSIIESLSDTATVGEWNIQGLPTDELSTQNGIIVTTASRYPLLIDPQNQGKAWIKNKEKRNNLIVSSLNHKYFRNHIEDAVGLGYPIIIEDIGEELDPVLDGVLEKSYIKIGTTFKVKIGDKEVDVNQNFRIYITTKLANPSYTPEIFARTSVVDFTVTIKGLEDQLLGRVILTEKRELETERTQLMIDVTLNRRKMTELEQNLLYKLTTTQGSLLDDDTVIGVLNVTKTTSLEVQEKLTVARETEIKINAAREEFRPVATRGSVLYFLVVSMSMVNMMYQTSLVQFLERFDLSMARSEKSPVTARRIIYINEYLTYEIFKYKSRGLYEKHKYMFVLLLTLRIDLERGTITHEEFQNFIKGGAALDLNACPPKPAKWITDSTWLNLVELSKLRHYQYIVQQVMENDKLWKTWFDKDAPEEANFPLTYNALDTFRKLLIVRAWCPDRTVVQSRKYIASSMGTKFAEPVILNFEVMYNESRPLTPMVCFLSTGSDPTPYIEQLAKKMEFSCKSISMGQGQEVHARKMMAAAMTDGFWALLQNCHLSLDYMNEVLQLFLELEKGIGSCHPNFRFWITTEEHPLFPISLLQICIKFTNEAPSGVRAGLLRTYTSMNQDMLDYSDAWQYIPLIYAISFLHTVVQERRKFGPLGWNIPYEYNSADWLASCIFVQNHLDDIDPKRGVSWVTLRYMLGEVHYGGRVTDDYDKRLLNTFCKFWFNDSLFLPEFEFAKGYKIIKLKQVADYLITIDKFAPTDPPQVYGLHPNADITYQTNSTSDMLAQMLSIQPKESGGGTGETREASVSRQAIDMLNKMPPNYDPFEVKERIRAMNHLNPLNIFLKQEIDRMQKVIGVVRTTLKDLLLAIEGTIIMNESLQDALDRIYDALVPGLWVRGSWAARSLGFWFTELLDRDVQFRTWCFKGRPPCFWMAGFFNPQGFLTAMKQEVARAHKGWALDQEGVYIYGLFLDGAGWDKRVSRLCESTNKVLYTMLPVVFVTAIYQTMQAGPTLYVHSDVSNSAPLYVSYLLVVGAHDRYLNIPELSLPVVYVGSKDFLNLMYTDPEKCPVYKKARRTDLNYITALNLVTNKNPDHWVLRGVALLCDTQ